MQQPPPPPHHHHHHHHHHHQDSDHPQLPTIKIHHPSSPRHHHSSATPTAGANRRIGVAVDLSDESAFAVRWAVDHYLRPGDAVILLHVSPTSVLFGADWGPLPHLPTAAPSPEHPLNPNPSPNHQNRPEEVQKSQDDFDAFTSAKVADLARPLKDAQIPYKIHIVKDHDMKERLCLEVERLGLSAVIMGSRGFGAARRGSDGKLGSVSDYCVHHCVCPVVVVRYPDEKDGGNGGEPIVAVNEVAEEEDEVAVSVARDEQKQKDA
ncbi:universal stress protein PHOS32-like [Syzygium oleosum]|uniref:universal stress protein PHOS32-like n=1 Tax=Syzygium oleosum TaxID=219896 RepID=UPI0024BBB71B|nr:universal stress protein PHOS32-like [Syzygium oleosum]XP_056173245.1 universal stress protein PHOS32-like [Syzygium oleosum]XP_056173246.1 universal stress protein PHOS32-like [Syzygium oleosum]